ncbi:TetR/AcrR family transcriptional regulator [Oceanobacillus kimchii]|uniref:TetR family transcriptional regulator n=1 Tax=Oceanobacillus kimchii TaxID=746691 RepID=A0ABQ5TPY9_9BACI|nr:MULTISPECIES: TetR/AcrR family transcriptional regulator [Oceanobacillus]MBT2599473.1 TetR/AcrR family transcriptional regulator [Oceanobacillus sp. ISL-74]MCT1576659.1 TetR/AcrR family transcriptional regulator [Oceanobacillus kimchii]MCT2134729.1 TetR/AcrR family transcriptional regulator [Oceanobacillus kimchii]OEH56028.1 TetR family transcriptional regulator [Oceanobacillus sp. E9]GLO67693.1 TetR family transcriptional regulator [Oceanobacillus kimchii]
MAEDRILSSVKDQQLVSKRRNQIIKGAMRLFQEKGFHRTTTREIAKESGFSIGTLYEYIRTKEDVLFLVCESIHDQVRDRIADSMEVENPSIENMRKAVRSFFYLMDDMQDEILMLYQETKSLKKETRDFVLQQERAVVDIMIKLLSTCLERDKKDKEMCLIANNIVVGGHMWGFRRWIIQKQFTLEEYIDLQMQHLDQLTKKIT